MKKIIITIVSVIIFIGSCIFLLGHYFGIYPPIPIGFKNGHLIVYKYACADICPNYGFWYKRYYGDITYSQCISLGGKPQLVGLINHYMREGYIGDGCRVD